MKRREDRTCSVPGCAGDFFAREMCRKHLQRFYTHGDPRVGFAGLPEDPVQRAKVRLYSKCRPQPNGCVFFIGSHGDCGHGQIAGLDGVNIGAHRLAWILRYGEPPAGMLIRHHCDNPMCVRIEHLALGTQKDNMADMWKRGRQGGQFPTTPHCRKGHSWTVANTKWTKTGRVCRFCTIQRRRIARQKVGVRWLAPRFDLNTLLETP